MTQSSESEHPSASGGQGETFQRCNPQPCSTPADASRLAGTGTVVPKIIRLLERLRSGSQRRAKGLDSSTCARLTHAYWLADNAQDEPSRALVRDAAIRLGARPNRRSGVAHLAIDIGFAQDEISPSRRSFYVKAVLGGQARGLTTDEFRNYLCTGPTGKGGLSELVRVFEGSINRLLGNSATSRPAPKGRDRIHLSLAAALLCEINVHREALKRGGELAIVIGMTKAGALCVQKVLGPCGLAAGSDTAETFGAASS